MIKDDYGIPLKKYNLHPLFTYLKIVTIKQVLQVAFVLDLPPTSVAKMMDVFVNDDLLDYWDWHVHLLDMMMMDRMHVIRSTNDDMFTEKIFIQINVYI